MFNVSLISYVTTHFLFLYVLFKGKHLQLIKVKANNQIHIHEQKAKEQQAYIPI